MSSVLITGANGGLGSAFVANFSNTKGYRGLYTVRNPTTAKDLNSALEKAPANQKPEVIALDMSSIESIRGVAADINARVANGTLEPIRALVLNAAFQDCNPQILEPKSFTKDGFGMNFGVNDLANFLFVLMVLQSMDKKNGRIVIISSWNHDPYHSGNDSTGHSRARNTRWCSRARRLCRKVLLTPMLGTELVCVEMETARP